MLTRGSSLWLRAAWALLFLNLSQLSFAVEREDCQNSSFQTSSEAATYGKLATDFTVATQDGSFRLKDDWNPCDVYVVFKTFTVPDAHPLKALSDAIHTMWQSSFDYLLQYSPRNAQYFFVSQNADAAQRLADQRIVQAHLDEALALLPAAEQIFWKKRIHIVTDDLANAGWIAAIGAESFVIDRNQRVRAIGVGAYSPLLEDGDFLKLAMEANYYNFQWERDKALASLKDDEVVTAFANETVQAGWAEFGGTIKEVEFPAADRMANYDSLLVDLELSCDKARCVYDSGLYYYDRVIEVYLCRDEKDLRCDTEVARWVTPFGLGGRWVHDISPLLALFHDGGKQRLRFHTVDKYNVSLKFHLGTTSPAALKPFAYKELFRGGKLDLEYNLRDALVFDVPAGTKRVQLVTVTTGHGWGKDTENCAEFCVTDHEWTINGGDSLVNKLENAGDTFACFLSTGVGVIPNQPGTWYFGRSGWCPGLEVKQKVWDVTSLVDLEGPNSVRYRGLYKGADYQPVAAGQGQETGYAPEIDLRSYLVFSR